eukprot:1055242-Rhodomonas_salina.1
MQKDTISVQSVPGMRFLVFDFAVHSRAWSARPWCDPSPDPGPATHTLGMVGAGVGCCLSGLCADRTCVGAQDITGADRAPPQLDQGLTSCAQDRSLLPEPTPIADHRRRRSSLGTRLRDERAQSRRGVCVRSAVSAREDEGEVGGLDAEIEPEKLLPISSSKLQVSGKG